MATSNPKLEARMVNISTATAYFPGELTYTGTNAIYTAQKIQHAKSDELCFIKIIWKISRKEG